MTGCSRTTPMLSAAVALLAILNTGLAEETTERKGPLKDLPSPEGPHIAKIKAMPEKSWLDLGSPAPDPKWGEALGRSWSSKMPFAPDMRGAFLTGEGRHGATAIRNGKRHYNDDVFFYDINAQRWICVYPGLELGKYNAKLNENGMEVDKDGHPLPIAWMVHAYNGVTYDPDRREFLTLHNPSGGGYWRKSMPERVAFLKAHRQGEKTRPTVSKSPWIYLIDKGHWDRKITKAKTPTMGHGCHLIYLPWLKQHFFTSKRPYMYDPAKNDWHALKAQGKPPLRPIDAASCLDLKRNRIYIAIGSYPKRDVPDNKNLLWAYNVEKNTWVDLQAKGKLPPCPKPVHGVNTSTMHYNAAVDKVLYFALSGKGQGIYAYDPDTNEWALVTNEYPKSWRAQWRRASHAFYDPELNVHFIFESGDSSPKGKMRVYRYKNPGGTP